jgi:CRISPR-associated protein Csc3
VEGHDYSVGEDIKIAFVYYDEFVANLTVGTAGESDRLIRALQADEDDEIANITEPELVASSFAPQYHLQPIYTDSENARLRQIRELLETLVSNGFKVSVGKPFTGFDPQDALFVDLVPTRRETAFGVDRVESFDDLNRSRRFFDILRSVADSSDYQGNRELISVPDDSFHALADLVVRESEWYEAVRRETHDHLTDSAHNTKYMKMRDVAQEGLNLYGKEYGSRHKKVKIFRLAVDSALDGLNRGLDEDELVEHTAGQIYKTAQEEDYTGRVTTGQAVSFVEALFEYLTEDDSFNKETLSQRRNTLANTYLFAYDQLLEEQRDEDEADAEEEAPA